MTSRVEKLEQQIAKLRRAARAEKRAQREADERELLALIRRAGLRDRVRSICLAYIDEREAAMDGRDK